jgi:hypothetical protein
LIGIKYKETNAFLKSNSIKCLFLVLSVISLFLWACSKKVDSSADNKHDEFVTHLKETYPEIKISRTVHPASSLLVEPKRLGVTGNGRLLKMQKRKSI